LVWRSVDLLAERRAEHPIGWEEENRGAYQIPNTKTMQVSRIRVTRTLLRAFLSKT
jgi:hypothetical protein